MGVDANLITMGCLAFFRSGTLEVLKRMRRLKKPLNGCKIANSRIIFNIFNYILKKY